MARVEWESLTRWTVGPYHVWEDDGWLVCDCGADQCIHRVAVQAARKLPPPVDSPMFAARAGHQLPRWAKGFWEGQWEAVRALLSSPKRVLILGAPTGSGKTFIAEMVRRALRVSTVYTCSSKQLQDQFLRDFPYAKLLKGRSNYPTADFPERFPELTAADCQKEDGVCPWCSNVHECPYEIAKKEALASPIAVLNTAYLLAEANYVGGFSEQSFVIIDEADLLEKALLDFIEVRIPVWMMTQVGRPQYVTKRESWLPWLQNVVKVATSQLVESPTNVEEIRHNKQLTSVIAGAKRVLEDKLSDNWVIVYGTGESLKQEPVIFKPIRVAQYAGQYLWRHAEKWLLMSATIISPEVFAENLGLMPDDWDYVEVPSIFPAHNRPIYITPAVKMSHKNVDGRLVMVDAVDKIIARYPNVRGIIHTVSYALSKLIKEHSRFQNRIVDSFAEHVRYPNSVWISPAIERGVDLPDELCRFQILVKVPFPDLSDKQVAARLYSKGGQAWYIVEAVRRIVQMTGRGVRHRDDYADTYILDTAFLDLRRRAWNLFPKWWRDAVIWHDKQQEVSAYVQQ